MKQQKSDLISHSPDSFERLLTVNEVSAWLRVPRSTLYGWRYAGTGPIGFCLGRGVRYRRSDVEAWLETRADSRDEMVRGPR
jgi:excisionase family DNA binding protein